MARYGCFVMAGLLLAGTPASAQSNDPFREATPPPPAGAPDPAPPRPRPAPEPEPVVAPTPPPQPAVVPVPTLPSAAQIWARVREVAQAESVRVPLASSPPFDVAGTPPQHRPLLGAWGPGTWQGSPAGDKVVLVIQSVDGDGNVRGVICTTSGPGDWSNFTAPLTGNRFTVHFQQSYSALAGNGAGTRGFTDNSWTFEFHADGRLSGSRGNGTSTVVLQRLQ